MFVPRPKQSEVLEYTRGKMGVSAVPGSGKTHTLSYLAAEMVSRGILGDDQEVLVVTLVNSAVDHFANRVGYFIKRRGLVPEIGYRVRTLHGLAHDIVRERPSLAGVSDSFQIIDERAANQILQAACGAWLHGNPHALDDYVSLELDEKDRERVQRREWSDNILGLIRSVIRQAKDRQITPSDLHKMLEPHLGTYPLLEMSCDIYADYQHALSIRGAVDFDDLIAKALTALRVDLAYLERLRERWPIILEDEAQDSSRLQEEILRLLAGPDGNWVRVGDPNQAIFETFTTANPQFLRDFLIEPDVIARELPNSGRSTKSIMSLANYLIDWTRQAHPVSSVRAALTPPHIEPTPPGDPQPNPPDDPDGVHLVGLMYTPSEEIHAVVDSLRRWLPDHQDQTVAVLVPTNHKGFDLVNALKAQGIAHLEILQSTRSTRETAGALTLVLKHLAEPNSPRHLEKVYRVWRRDDRADPPAREKVDHVAGLVRKCRRVEEFLWPRLDRDWLARMKLKREHPQYYDELIEFRTVVNRWHDATILPIDQLLLTLAQDLFTEPAELALTHKLAVILRQANQADLRKRLPELIIELEVVARNERRFLGLSQDDICFDPTEHKGVVVVTTVHKAKGLEWDRVYLMSVNNYDYPSAQPHDLFISEKWFVRDNLNLEAEALSELQNLNGAKSIREGEATEKARLDYAAERLRLFYVGITRAKKELIITWNTGRRRDMKQATPFIALQNFWDKKKNGPDE